MQFETILRARTPRANCTKCGVKTSQVPWAEKSSRFTLMFEAFAIQVLQAASSVKCAAELLGLDWGSANEIMRRAVERGLKLRSTDGVSHIGIDEKSFLKGQSYASLLIDLEGARVLEAVEGRTEESADTLLRTLSPEQRKTIKAVAIDMWQPFLNAIAKNASEAAIVHDKFHVSKHLNEALDQVRRAENKTLRQEGDETLKGTRQLWLYNEPNLTDDAAARFESLKESELKTARAWAIKEHFRWFWTYHHPGLRTAVLRQVVRLGQPFPPQADHQDREAAQASSRQSADLHATQDHQLHGGGIQQQDPEHQIQRPRLSFLRQLSNKNPLLLRQAQPAAAGSEPLFFLKNQFPKGYPKGLEPLPPGSQPGMQRPLHHGHHKEV